MQTVVVKRSCAGRSCLHSLEGEKGDYLSRCVIEGGRITSKMWLIMLPMQWSYASYRNNTHWVWQLLRRCKVIKYFKSGLCGKSRIYKQNWIGKAPGGEFLEYLCRYLKIYTLFSGRDKDLKEWFWMLQLLHIKLENVKKASAGQQQWAIINSTERTNFCMCGTGALTTLQWLGGHIRSYLGHATGSGQSERGQAVGLG